MPNNKREENSKELPSIKTYSSDTPLTNPKDDEFGRFSFAKRLAQTISDRKDSSSLVIALYGKWGEGKTTVLNFIEGELKDNSNIVPMFFNPWRFPSETELLLSFYTKLAEKLGKSLPSFKEKIGNWLYEYLPPFVAVFDKADVAKEFGILLSKVKIEELRDRIETMLIDENKIVVVLMDDIDRLEKAEIHSVFRLVKLSANLKNLVYILAFDDEIVSDALQERYGTSNKEAGRNFLEKIVQVPIDLPYIEPQQLRRFCFSAIDTILNQCGIKLSENETQLFVRDFSRGVEIRLQTPRLAIRYANMLVFSLPMVKGEVNIVDFLLIEAIRAFYPIAYDVIRNSQEILVGKSLTEFNISEKETNNFRVIIDRSFFNLTQKEAEALKILLSSLFPRLQTIYGNTSYGREWDQSWNQDKKVAADRYFSRYFLYSVSSNDVSDQAIDAIIDGLQNDTLEDISMKILALLNPQNAESLIYKVNLLVESIPPDESLKLASVLSMMGDKFPSPLQLFSFDTPFARAAMLIARLIENKQYQNNNLILAEQIINNGKPITFPAEIISWLETDKSRYPKAISEDDKKRLVTLFSERISRELSKGLSIFDDFSSKAPLLLFYWGKYKSRDEVNNFVQDYIDENPSNVNKVLNNYVGIAYPIGNGLPHKGDFEREEYNKIANAFDPSIISAKLEQIYGNDLYSDEYPRFDKDVDKIIARQFIWIHKLVEAENRKSDTHES